MVKSQCKNTVKNKKGNMVPLEPSYPTISRPDYSNAAKAQENNLRNNFMKMIEAHKEEILKNQGKDSQKIRVNQQIP